VALIEDVSNQSVAFAEVKVLIFTGHNSCCVLSSMLENEETVVEHLADMAVGGADDADDATHRNSQLPASAVGIWTLPAAQTTMMGSRLAPFGGENLALDSQSG
jgi:hypothetical protein